MQDNGRVLAVGAHPDDVEFMCAGTLALLHRKGYAITIATMAPGDCGTSEWSSEQIAAMRRREATESAAILEGRYICLEERDLAIDPDTRTRRKVTSLIREVDPFLVLTHPPVDYMMDHEHTSRLVRDACFAAGVPNFAGSGGEKATSGVPYLYYWDPVDLMDHYGNRVEAEFVINITPVFETKKRMLLCHASQRNWLLQHHGVDEYVETLTRWASERGRQIGVQHGEGFRQYKGHAYPSDNILTKLI